MGDQAAKGALCVCRTPADVKVKFRPGMILVVPNTSNELLPYMMQAEAIITERLLTHGDQVAESDMEIVLDGEDSKGRVISRSVAQDRSSQVFYPRMVGNAQCFGHVQCDSIIMGDAKIKSIPAITANCTEAQLVHEAAIGKIAGDQLLKLETLGLTEEEAEDCILKGFLA